MRFIVNSLAAAALLCGASAHAEGGFIGAVGGVMNTDYVKDSPLNAGVRAGYNWASGWGVESEFTGSIADGRMQGYWEDVDYSLSTRALYATYRSQGQTYFKSRIGYLSENIDTDDYSASDSGLSAGLGFGFYVSDNATVEGEYTLVEEDVGFWSGSVVVRF